MLNHQKPNNRKHKDWTFAETQTAIAMAALGHTAKEIGSKLTRSRNSVIGHALRKKIKLGQRQKPAKPISVINHGGGRKRKIFFDPRPKLKWNKVVCGVTMMDIKNGECRYPIGEPRDVNFCMCGHPSGDKVYCANHSRIAFLPTRPLMR